jgi:hypothetical protein
MRQYYRARIIGSEEAIAEFRAAAAPASEARPASAPAPRPSYTDWGRASRTG